MNKNIELYEYKKSATEVIDILNYLPKEMTCKIPRKFWMFLQEQCLTEYKPNFDFSKGLDKIKLSNKTKSLLAMIYRNYMCSEEEKIEYDKILFQNEEKYQKELKEKYNPDNLFKEPKKQKNAKDTESKEVKLVQVKDTIFTKLKRLIKKLIRK